MWMMDDILWPFKKSFVVIYLDDIFIFSQTWEEHLKNIQYVLGVDDCIYVRHYPEYKLEREPPRGVCGSYLIQSWNVKMASSIQRVEKNSRRFSCITQ
jgi:hypothetical protein